MKEGAAGSMEMLAGVEMDLKELMDFGGGKPLIRLMGILDQITDGLLIRVRQRHT
jgi:hypothetical protein